MIIFCAPLSFFAASSSSLQIEKLFPGYSLAKRFTLTIGRTSGIEPSTETADS